MDRTYKILIIEDEEALAKALKLKFEESGCIAEIASDGSQALVVLESEKFDLVVLDILMPKIDGWDVLESLKGKGQKIMVLSNLGQQEDVKRALDAGAIDYLVKSRVSLSNIADRVIKLLGS